MRKIGVDKEPTRVLLSLNLPLINPHLTAATVDQIHAARGVQLAVGGRFLDLTVDLSLAAPHDCPPVGHYRLMVRDRVWLRQLFVGPGDEPLVGAALALFSTEPDEPLDARPAREARYSIAGVIPEMDWDA